MTDKPSAEDAALIAVMLSALRSARATLTRVFGDDRAKEDATVREIDAAIERAEGK